MKRTKKIIIIAIAIAVLLLIGKIIIDASRNLPGEFDSSNLAIAEVIRGDLKVTVSGNGQAEFSEKKEIFTHASGEISRVNVADGDYVIKGDVMAEMDLSDIISAKEDEIKQLKNKIDIQNLNVKEQARNLDDIRNTKESITVTSPYSGILSELTVRVGDNMQTDQRFGAINDNSKVKITLPFDKNKITTLESGHRVYVYLIDFLDKDVKTLGEVVSITNSQDGGQVIADVEVVLDGKEGFEAGANASFSVLAHDTVVPPLRTGKIEWIDSHTLISSERGRVKEVLVEQGDEISKGDAICVLENKNIDLDIEKAQYALEGAQLELDILNEQLNRLKEELEDLIADSLIEAPINGVVSNLFIEEGDDIKAGTSIAVVSSDSELVIPVEIDELDIAEVKEGLPAEITLDALGRQIFEGTVDKIAIEGINKWGVGSFEVVIRLSESDSKRIKPGMSANVEIIVSEKADTLLLPIEAVRKIDDLYMVNLKRTELTESPNAVPSAADNMVPIKVGLASASYVEILEGLSEGDEVIITGQGPNYDYMMPGFYVE
ncbi:MAG: efflux RND transporter periplasmic adaptor subunit [Acetivibrionales bacterium]|nr:HlyD family efflux transporter periplasmic adaptor subunit [Clostridiaceae bacterium]